MLEIHGHRGARGLLPENTLPAFERAIALGVDALEFDVGMTRDGVPVVHHDTALNPDHTRDAGGAWLEPPGPLLRNLDVAALSSLDVGRVRPGSRTSLRFPHQEPCDGARIPTLAEVLALGRRPGAGAVRFNIEIKLLPLEPEETAGPEALAQAVVAVLRAEGMMGRATAQSFDWRVLRELRRLAPELSIACLTSERGWRDTVLRGRAAPSPWTAGLSVDACGGSVPRLVHRFGSAEWMPFHADLTAEALAEARELGLKVTVWTVNELRDMRALAGLGVDGIVTDYPDRAGRFASMGDPTRSWTETVSTADGELRLTWSKLLPPFSLVLPVGVVDTIKHEIHTVLYPAQEAEVVVGGRSAAGQAQPDQLGGQPHSTAFLALSETWYT